MASMLNSRESETNPFDELPGLAKYVLSDELGTGAFSTVKRCRHKETGTEYAIKIIDNQRLSRFPDYQPTSLMREVEILKKLRHPNVISLHAAFRSERAIFLVTELATGGELFDHIIARGHYTEPDAREIISQVLQAVSYLHDQDVIHRDIKPENILVSTPEPKPGESSTGGELLVKLSDFGLAKFIGEGAQMAMTTCGTPTYSAPEVWCGAYTNKVDCYSVGVLMFVMLSGHFPKVNSDGPVFVGKVWSEVSRDGRDLVAHLMDPDPTSRMSAKTALQHLWIVGDIPQTPLSSARARLRKASQGMGGVADAQNVQAAAQWHSKDMDSEPPVLAAPPKGNRPNAINTRSGRPSSAGSGRVTPPVPELPEDAWDKEPRKGPPSGGLKPSLMFQRSDTNPCLGKAGVDNGKEPSSSEEAGAGKTPFPTIEVGDMASEPPAKKAKTSK